MAIIDDPTIGDMARKLAEERLRSITQCTCVIPDDGSHVDSSKCPVHKAATPIMDDGCCGLRVPPVGQAQFCPEHPEGTMFDTGDTRRWCCYCDWQMTWEHLPLLVLP